jgi:hypothetical protein
MFATWKEVVDELLRIRTLQNNWDGEGSPAPAPALVDAALRFAGNLEKAKHPLPDTVYASGYGTVYLEWQTSPYREVIEVLSAGQMEIRCAR